METIIVTTDFSPSSANALDYACAFAKAYSYRIALIYIFTIPATYTAEGLSLVTLDDEMAIDRRDLKDELDRARSCNPDTVIEASIVTGGFVESLQAYAKDLEAEMIIMGARGGYSEIFMWDEAWLQAVINIACPVLIIPPGISFKPYTNIAFACNYKRNCLPPMAGFIKKLVKRSNAHLQIVHVTPDMKEYTGNANIAGIQRLFADAQPVYHVIENSHTIQSISDFTQQSHTDLLVVAPHKHGVWHNLFSKSNTKQLANFNHLPVLAVHN